MTSSMLHFSVTGDEAAWNLDNVDAAFPTLFASLFVKDVESTLLGVLGDEMDEFCEGVVGGLLVLFAVVLFPRFLFFAIFEREEKFVGNSTFIQEV